MKKFLVIAIFQINLALLALVVSAAAQTPSPSATPPEDDGDVVKISTTLIQLDVVVTDKKGNQVTDLKPGDFEIYENGEKQDITNFSYIFNQTENKPQNNKATNSTDKFSVPPPPAKLKLEQVKRTYAIVVDDLGLSFESISAVKYALKKTVSEQMREGDLVAIIRTGGGIGALQSFTSDKRQLLAAIEKIKWNPRGRGDISAFAPLSSLSAQSNDSAKAQADEEAERVNAELRSETFSVGTLGALSYVIRGMKELPGRKSIMLVSEGFQILTKEHGIPTTTRVLDNLKLLADLANRASVIFYTLDPRGLDVPSALTAADDTAGFTPGQVSQRLEDRHSNFLDSQDSLVYLARETGGTAYVNRNRLDNGLREAIEDQSGYYLIAYQPDSETFDPKKNKFNKFKVRVKRDGLKVRYRSGFFGISDEKIAQTAQTPTQQIYTALTSPFGASDISLGLNALFTNDETAGNFVRSLININAGDLSFTKETNGLRKANFDIVAMTFGDNGTPINQVAKNYTIQVSEENYLIMLKKGFIYNLLLPIEKPGAYQFRVALRDSATGKIGSASQFIEIPNLDKKRLALSGVVLSALTPDELNKNTPGQIQNSGSNTFSDTALRQFRHGTVLRYDYIIYNAATNPTKLTVQAKLFRDNQIVLEGEPSELDTSKQTDLRRIEAAGAVTLGKDLPPGNYVLQILVNDENAKEKYSVAAQVVDFEIVQ